MKRKITEKMFEWKQKFNGKTALLIDGARRVGKSYIVEEFAKNNYKSYIIINFDKANDYVKDLFNNYLEDLDNLFILLSGLYNTKLYERESLIIFDEVQEFPKARSAIKYLVEDGRYDYIETGSLMSIKENVKDIMIPSEEQHIEMFPLDFEEFLWALGNDTLMDTIRTCFVKQIPLGQALHRKIMTYFRQYIIVGGMPQAVLEYSKSKDFNIVDTIKRNILNLYRDDIAKHSNNNSFKIERIFDEIPSQLQKPEKKFQLSSINSDARYREYDDALFWLFDSMIVNPCFNTIEPSIGLKMKMDSISFKCYLGDTGLLISHSFDENGIVSEELYKKILFDKLEFNYGMIIENVVAQMLRASGHKLFFYSNSSRENNLSRMEIDFLIEKNKISSRHNISPIEVKSSKNYTINSLNKFINKYNEQLNVAYVLHTSDLKIENGIVYLPIYMTGLL